MKEGEKTMRKDKQKEITTDKKRNDRKRSADMEITG
jgi:hypothetical protein